jgi:hypothetical protein
VFHNLLVKSLCFLLCSTSDDNLLKNIELFDKLSLRFSGRVLFIKDVIGSSEICCWSFYGHGKKVAEVCCTSIVYATDKKHTKVMFEVFWDYSLSWSKSSCIYLKFSVGMEVFLVSIISRIPVMHAFIAWCLINQRDHSTILERFFFFFFL